ncbi:alpha/beta fold hydrolase [Phyllobacterium myrsinacearum]|uniref:Pimeloyl-ACP methyl ester carboxylesterase n=1 Tax=Phyllobacterium myrsinacearum TaxID=28101 RepID=A0A839EWP4_9HYPH|nr:alpha/beta fold hydrolase [Phyllobacterium myrsinacearum]MBA8880817.1 pimeloyl-ACP methyl ester carboxylesterase [Phyllobacterium myrsinacearum]
MTFPTKTGTLKVPGAKIYYEARGSGPLLLLISGGPTDAGVFTELSHHLADRYTVVAYDPRGNSRSAFDGESQTLELDVHGDDAARLIEALGDGPAFVMGNSGGAQIGLNLAARYPEKVRTLVAHEPPCLMLLPDPSEALAGNKEIHDTYRRDGVEAAMQKFMEMAGMDEHGEGGEEEPQAPPPPEALETFGRINGNMEYFLAHGLMPLSLYRPDVEVLRAGKPRVVVGVGEETVGEITYRTGIELANKLGTEPVHFPGDHGGYGAHAAAFAKTLHTAFTQA